MAVNYAGTISVTNGSAVVTGTGTEWTTLTVASDYILVTADGTICKVSALASSTELTLTKNFAGATASNVEYEIFPTIGADVELGLLVKGFMDDVRDIVDGGTALLTALQSAYDTWIADRQAEFDAAQSQRATDFTAAQNARASQFASARAQQDLDIANAMNGLEGAPIAKAIPSGAVASCEVNPWATPGDHFAWMLDGSKSWAKEDRVTTTYLGVHNTTASAWAVSGAAAGDWYWDGTNRNIYILTGTAGATLSTLNRFGAAHFDARFAIAYSDRVVLVDGDGVPWMVFEPYVNGQVLEAWRVSRTPTSIEFCGSTLLFGTSNASTSGVVLADFASDKYGRIIENSALSGWAHGIATRGSETLVEMTGLQLLNARVNAVAAMVRDSAPADPVTGLPVPTIAVATDGGVSVVKDDGTVVNGGVNNSTWNVREVLFDQEGRIWSNSVADPSYGGLQLMAEPPYDTVADFGSGSLGYSKIRNTSHVHGVTDAWPFLNAGSPVKTVAAGPALISAASNWEGGLSWVFDNPSDRSKSMVAYQTEGYATPPMFGDVKTALFTERGAASLVGAELVTNGTFDTDVSGWQPSSFGDETISWESGKLRVTYGADGASGSSGAYQALTGLVIGETYIVTVAERSVGTNGAVGVGVYTSNPRSGLVAQVYGFSSASDESFEFVATASTLYLWVFGGYGTAGSYVEADGISVRLATPDRSVSGKGAVIHGTISRDEDGWHSGFSASDYIEQPYNSDLDFGTGDFYVRGRFKTSSAANQYLFQRNAVHKLGLRVNTDGKLYVYHDTVSHASLGVVNDGGEHTFVFVRKNGVSYLYIDGVFNSSASNTKDMTTGAGVFRIGQRATAHDQVLQGSLEGFALGAGAPSAAQIRIMSNWKGDVIEGTIHDTSYVESTQGLWVLTSTYLYEIVPDGAERSKQVNDIGATTLTAFHGGRLVS